MVRKVRVYSRALRSPQRLAETLHQERHLPAEEDKHGECRKGAWANRKLHEGFCRTKVTLEDEAAHRMFYNGEANTIYWHFFRTRWPAAKHCHSRPPVPLRSHRMSEQEVWGILRDVSAIFRDE
jgi:hypothetical protein